MICCCRCAMEVAGAALFIDEDIRRVREALIKSIIIITISADATRYAR